MVRVASFKPRFRVVVTAAGKARRFDLLQSESTCHDDLTCFMVDTDGDCDLLLFTDLCRFTRFHESDLSVSARARNRQAIKLGADEHVVSLLIANGSGDQVITVCENGYGKRTPLTEYPCFRLGASPRLGIQHSERNGKLVAALITPLTAKVIIIDNGDAETTVAVATGIREMGRTSQGMALISPTPDLKVSAVSGTRCEPDNRNVPLTPDELVEEFQTALAQGGLTEAITVDLSAEGRAIALDRIVSTLRGKGNADQVMKILLSICDKNGLDITVIPHSLDDTTDTAKLVDWYRRHGFVRLSGDISKMRRKSVQ